MSTHGRDYTEPIPDEDLPPLEAERHPKTFQEAWDLLSSYADSNELFEIIVNISKRIAREFPFTLDSDDLVQEWHLYVCEHPNRAKVWLTTDKETRAVKFGYSSFKRDAAGIMAKAARVAKAKAVGYDVEDEVYYSKAQLQELLPYVFIEPTLVASTKDPEGRYAAPDHAKGGNHLASVIDVRMAWDKVVHVGSQWDKIMRGLYQVHATQAQVAEANGLTRPMVSRTHDRCLDALLAEMHGTRPIQSDGPGTRRAASNAACIARTENQ